MAGQHRPLVLVDPRQHGTSFPIPKLFKKKEDRRKLGDNIYTMITMTERVKQFGDRLYPK